MVLGVDVDELLDAAVGVTVEEGAGLDGVAAAGSFFSPAFFSPELFSPELVPPVSLPVLDGGLSLSE